WPALHVNGAAIGLKAVAEVALPGSEVWQTGVVELLGVPQHDAVHSWGRQLEPDPAGHDAAEVDDVAAVSAPDDLCRRDLLADADRLHALVLERAARTRHDHRR